MEKAVPSSFRDWQVGGCVAKASVAFEDAGQSDHVKSAIDGLTFYEFFAGGGMARAGLGTRWTCLFANDFDFKKGEVYCDNWGTDVLVVKDVATIKPSELPSSPALVWASFPCQDLSLAGMGAGLRGERSGTFWPFWNLMKKLQREGRGPRIVVLENVCGTLTSHAGKDFRAIADALSEADYRFGAVVMNAAAFVPQSRPRLFIVAVAKGREIPDRLQRIDPSPRWHTSTLRRALERLSEKTKQDWIWWNLPVPRRRVVLFSQIIEKEPEGVMWHSLAETARLLSMMSAINLRKIELAKNTGRPWVGTVYKRTRCDESGAKIQRAEVRFDDVAGCLRTPAGGSSRQIIVVVDGKTVRSRLISSRETARLMGLPEEYKLPRNYNEAYHLTGDGVVVPVVRHLAANLLEPILLA